MDHRRLGITKGEHLIKVNYCCSTLHHGVLLTQLDNLILQGQNILLLCIQV